MSDLYTPLGNYPKKFNKRESKLADKVSSDIKALLSHFVVAAIVATNVSQTVDFAALVVGDKVIHVPAVAGNSDFSIVATAGTLPAAAVVGDLYVVLRAK
jgi:hypothetical protein